jgi:hypothetical protein
LPRRLIGFPVDAEGGERPVERPEEDARLYLCENIESASFQPLGFLEWGETYVVGQELGWENESYVVYEGVERIVSVAGGGCWPPVSPASSARSALAPHP